MVRVWRLAEMDVDMGGRRLGNLGVVHCGEGEFGKKWGSLEF
jgi:hypothetical protein